MDKIIFINRSVVPIGPHPLNWDTQWTKILVCLNQRLLRVLDYFMKFYFLLLLTVLMDQFCCSKYIFTKEFLNI